MIDSSVLLGFGLVSLGGGGGGGGRVLFHFSTETKEREEGGWVGFFYGWVGGWMDWISQPVDYQTPSRTFRDPNEWNDSLETQSRGGS